MQHDPKYTSLSHVQADLRAGKYTMESLVQHYLDQAELHAGLNAFIETWDAEALEAARRLDEKRTSNPDQLGKLAGMVLSIKDNICYKKHRVSAASKILQGFEAPNSATAVERLLAEDAILIGRTNCDQFGMGSSNENSIYGPVKNALDTERVPGGSSGGAAVSVQMDACLAAIGSDTGGSVRQPAAFCGLYGLKPSYGRISRHGLLAYGSSFDQIGFIGRNPADLALLMQIASGPDAFDSTAIQQPLSYPQEESSQTKRIAYLAPIAKHPNLDPEIKRIQEETLQKLRHAGHTLVEADFDLLEFVVPTYYVLTTAEASANLSRYDGIRYGYRSPQAQNLEQTYLLSRSEGFSEEVKRRILLGTFVLSSGYYDAYYAQAQKVRRLIRDRLLAIFEEADLILIPVSTQAAWKFGEKNQDPTSMYLSDVFTVLANLAGLPALAFPAGTHSENHMPIGMQFMAAPGMELMI